jgi:hypothetical protein
MHASVTFMSLMLSPASKILYAVMTCGRGIFCYVEYCVDVDVFLRNYYCWRFLVVSKFKSLLFNGC